ncbi:MAG: ABC transporter permease subunit [Propionibacteriales bacterium]|nr:ABC transporter permease subunit [Propionibacteriales bacterium]
MTALLVDPPRRTRSARDGDAPPLLTAAGVAVAALTLLPLGFVVTTAVTLGPDEVRELLFRDRVAELLWNTLRLVFGGVLLSTVLGVAVAWLVERSDLPWRPAWRAVLAAPLAVPAFVNGYGWVSLTHDVQSYWGAVLVVSLSYYPLVYLPVVAGLRSMDPGLEDVARSLGEGAWSTFFRVVLPALRPAVLGGALLVALHLLAEYGALRLLNYPTLTTAILDNYRSTFNGASASLLAGVLVMLCLLLLIGELRLRGRRSLARVGGGAPQPAGLHRLGAATPWCLGGLLMLVALSLGVPCASLARWLVVGSSTEFVLADLAATTGTTVGLALAAGLLTTLLAVPVAWLAVRHRGVVADLVERSTYTANALPGIVVALALVTISIRVVQPLYQTVPLLLLAYAILFLPRAMVSVRSALELAPARLDDVAHSLGASRIGAARRVTLPMILPGLGASTALVFLAAGTELTATLLLAPTGTTTLATAFWSRAESVAYGAAAPYALLLILLSLPATHLLTRYARGRR